MNLSCECMFLGSLSCHNKNLEWRTLSPLAGHSSRRTDRVIALRSRTDRVTAQCYSSIYLDDSRKIHLWGMRAHRSKDVKIAPSRGRERERERGKRALAPLFTCFSVPGPVLCKLECCLFYLRFSHSLGPSLFYFPGLSLPGLLATTILGSFSLF